MPKNSIILDIEKEPAITISLIIHGDPPRILETIKSIKDQAYPKSKITIMCLDNGSSPRARNLLM